MIIIANKAISPGNFSYAKSFGKATFFAAPLLSRTSPQGASAAPGARAKGLTRALVRIEKLCRPIQLGVAPEQYQNISRSEDELGWRIVRGFSVPDDGNDRNPAARA